MFKRLSVLFVVGMIAVSVSGCGYTTKSMLPENIKQIYVRPVKNAINLSGETSDQDRFRVYRPGVEVDLTNAIMNRFIFDGNLKVASKPESADAIVDAKLTDYRRDPLRYSDSDDIQEYRLSLAVDVTVLEARTQKVLWHELVVGDTHFFLSGTHAVSEDDALVKAVDDTSRRVVEKTIELWK